jgi:hypothetical protein
MGSEAGHLVAQAIEENLQGRGLSVGWLAADIGMDVGLLDAKLSARADLTVVDLANIATALGVSASSLTPSAP